jgi:ArsR family transcriptional regulator
MEKKFIDLCDVSCIHEENVVEVRQKMLDDAQVVAIADIFKALGDPTRVRLIFALLQKELCVCDLAAVIGATESAVSHQLRFA